MYASAFLQRKGMSDFGFTPGVVTDAFGFLCLVPGFRAIVKREVVRRFESAVAENRVHLESVGFQADRYREPPRDVTPPGDER